MEFKTATERLLYQGRTYHEMYFTKSMGLNEISKSVPWDTSESEIISVLQAYTDIVKDHERRKVPVPEVHPLDRKPAFVKIGRKSVPECDGNSEGQVKLSMSFRNESIFEIAIDVSQLRELLRCI